MLFSVENTVGIFTIIVNNVNSSLYKTLFVATRMNYTQKRKPNGYEFY